MSAAGAIAKRYCKKSPLPRPNNPTK